MKYLLIALLIKDPGMSPPWATSLVAEFDDRPACEAAVKKMEQFARRPVNADVTAWCQPKGSEAKSEK